MEVGSAAANGGVCDEAVPAKANTIATLCKKEDNDDRNTLKPAFYKAATPSPACRHTRNEQLDLLGQMSDEITTANVYGELLPRLSQAKTLRIM
jgi:hypothetical protein